MKKVRLKLVPKRNKPQKKIAIKAPEKIITIDFRAQDPKPIGPIIPEPGPMNLKPGTSVVWEDPQNINWQDDREFLLRTVPEIGPGPFSILETRHAGLICCEFAIADSNGELILNGGQKWWHSKLFKRA